MKIVFRADDAGSTEGANLAIVETARHGVVRNVSIMVPGPAFGHAVSLLKALENVDLGLHVTLSSEWDTPKWGPVLPPSKVPTLVEGDGSFTQNPGVLYERGFSVDEAMAEVAAQLARARDAGLKIAYLDEHMGVGWIGLTDRLRQFAHQEGLVYAGDVPNLDDLYEGEGPVVTVFHPGSDDDPIMAGFIHIGLSPGQVHAERIADRRTATDPLLCAHESLTYREAVVL